MTNKKLALFVVDKLLEQGRRSIYKGCCRYRFKGLKCPAGHLIKDEFYTSELENCTVNQTGPRKALYYSGIKIEQLPIVESLQYIHDGTGDANFVSTMTMLKAELENTSEQDIKTFLEEFSY